MDIRVVRKEPAKLKIAPLDEEFGRDTKIKPRIEKNGKRNPGFWLPEEKMDSFSDREKNDCSFGKDRATINFSEKIGIGKISKAGERLRDNFKKRINFLKAINGENSARIGWAALVFLSFVTLSVYKADGYDSMVALGEENPTVLGGVGVSISGVNPKISVSSQENRIADLEEKNLELSRMVDSISDQTKFFPTSSGKDVSQDDEIAKQEKMISELEDQIKAMSDQNEAIIDFSLALDYKSLIYKDKAGNLEISDGKIIAEEAVLEKVSIRNEEGKPLVGEGKILPFKKDDNLDGLDDENLSDGKSVIIRTEALGENSRIFITPKAASPLKNPLTVTEKQNGQYFKVEIAEKTSEEIGFDWWVIEAK
jgi:hypothetical protein